MSNNLESIKRPNFFFVGHTRSGTTSLKEELNQHPDIYFYYPSSWKKANGPFGFESSFKNDEEFLEEFSSVLKEIHDEQEEQSELLEEIVDRLSADQGRGIKRRPSRKDSGRQRWRSRVSHTGRDEEEVKEESESESEEEEEQPVVKKVVKKKKKASN